MSSRSTLTQTICLDCGQAFLRTGGGRLTLYCESCQDVRACLDERALRVYATGVLPDEACGRIERHVARCSFCADLLGRSVEEAVVEAALKHRGML